MQQQRAIIADTAKQTNFDDPARAQYHDLYYADRLAAAQPVQGRKPVLTMLLGRPASGKSQWLRPQVMAVNPKAVIVDADVAKSYLPEQGRLPAAHLYPGCGPSCGPDLRAHESLGLLKAYVSYDNNVPLGERPRLHDKGGDWPGYDWR